MSVDIVPAGEGRKIVKLRPLYSCGQLCGRTPDNPSGIRRLRAARRCSLPDFDPAAWDPKADRPAAAEAEMLASFVIGPAANQGVNLNFDLDRDGCPEGWARSRFAQSVELLMGRRGSDEDERRQPSLRMLWALQRGDRPDRPIEAVEIAEAHQDGCFRLYRQARNG